MALSTEGRVAKSCFSIELVFEMKATPGRDQSGQITYKKKLRTHRHRGTWIYKFFFLHSLSGTLYFNIAKAYMLTTLGERNCSVKNS